jgi:hypothetical protein
MGIAVGVPGVASAWRGGGWHGGGGGGWGGGWHRGWGGGYGGGYGYGFYPGYSGGYGAYAGCWRWVNWPYWHRVNVCYGY